ncbi:MAG: type II secretion system F family protein [Candidatus Gracilibacteria bacterium]|nr:type II secretion system F family protein [Candidatus Gracilibacteria bacterium]
MTPNEQNLVILDVEESVAAKETPSIMSYIKGFFKNAGGITLRQKVVFFRIMATMTNASMTVLKSLDTLKKQEKDKKMLAFYNFVIERVKSGSTLNDSLRSYYDNFTDAECSIIEAGERTGKLNQALLQIADQTEKMDSISRKIRGAMIYPAVLIIGMIAVIIVLMVKVIPTLLEFFGDPETLPESTKMILGMSNFFQAYWPVLVIGVVAMYVFYAAWKKTPNGKYLNDKMILKAPIAGPIVQKVILSRFARVFSNLIGSGVSIVEAIRIVASAVGNEVYRQRILLLRQDIKAGKKMAESLEDDPMFPELLVAMLRVGEETAQIGNTVIKIADFYDEEVDIAIGSIQKLIEPFILVMMGAVIGFIAIGVMQPMMGLAGAIGA